MIKYSETKRNIAELQLNHVELYSKMTDLFCQFDPCRFINIGLPKEEYNCEISEILSRIAGLENINQPEIKEIVDEVFYQWLNFEFENEKHLDNFAGKILEIVKNYI